MLVGACYSIIYVAVILSLFAIDYVLGHGFVDMSYKIICKIMCFVKKAVKEETKNAQTEVPISIPIMLTEIVVLSLTIAFLNKYKHSRSYVRMDELLKESKDALRQTNEFLEKWRLRRDKYSQGRKDDEDSRANSIQKYTINVPTEYSYLDDEPQEIKPLKLEVPILHMAIIDTLGTTRSKLERGDAGDTVNVVDSTLLSVTSLINDDLDSVTETTDQEDVKSEENLEFRNRYLWDVLEEDSNLED